MNTIEYYIKAHSKCDEVLTVFAIALKDKTKADTHFKIRKAIDELLDLRNRGADLDPIVYVKNLKDITMKFISYAARDKKTHREVEDLAS